MPRRSQDEPSSPIQPSPDRSESAVETAKGLHDKARTWVKEHDVIGRGLEKAEAVIDSPEIRAVRMVDPVVTPVLAAAVPAERAHWAAMTGDPVAMEHAATALKRLPEALPALGKAGTAAKVVTFLGKAAKAADIVDDLTRARAVEQRPVPSAPTATERDRMRAAIFREEQAQRLS